MKYIEFLLFVLFCATPFLAFFGLGFLLGGMAEKDKKLPYCPHGCKYLDLTKRK